MDNRVLSKITEARISSEELIEYLVSMNQLGNIGSGRDRAVVTTILFHLKSIRNAVEQYVRETT